MDESKIVSSSSDLSASQSEVQAFKLLKSFIASSYGRPQPQQEITSTDQGKILDKDLGRRKKKKFKKSDHCDLGDAQNARETSILVDDYQVTPASHDVRESKFSVVSAGTVTGTQIVAQQSNFENAVKAGVNIEQCHEPHKLLCAPNRQMKSTLKCQLADNSDDVQSPASGNSSDGSRSFAVVGTVEFTSPRLKSAGCMDGANEDLIDILQKNRGACVKSAESDFQLNQRLSASSSVTYSYQQAPPVSGSSVLESGKASSVCSTHNHNQQRLRNASLSSKSVTVSSSSPFPNSTLTTTMASSSCLPVAGGTCVQDTHHSVSKKGSLLSISQDVTSSRCRAGQRKVSDSCAEQKEKQMRLSHTSTDLGPSSLLSHTSCCCSVSESNFTTKSSIEQMESSENPKTKKSRKFSMKRSNSLLPLLPALKGQQAREEEKNLPQGLKGERVRPQEVNTALILPLSGQESVTASAAPVSIDHTLPTGPTPATGYLSSSSAVHSHVQSQAQSSEQAKTLALSNGATQAWSNLITVPLPASQTSILQPVLQGDSSLSSTYVHTTCLNKQAPSHVEISPTRVSVGQDSITQRSSQYQAVHLSPNTAISSSPQTQVFLPIDQAECIRSVTRLSPGKSFASILEIERLSGPILDSRHPSARILEKVSPSYRTTPSPTDELSIPIHQSLSKVINKPLDLNQNNQSLEAEIITDQCVENSISTHQFSPSGSLEVSHRSISPFEVKKPRRLVAEYGKKPVSKVANRREQKLELGEFHLKMRQQREKFKDSRGKFVCKVSSEHKQSLKTELKHLSLDLTQWQDKQPSDSTVKSVRKAKPLSKTGQKRLSSTPSPRSDKQSRDSNGNVVAMANLAPNPPLEKREKKIMPNSMTKTDIGTSPVSGEGIEVWEQSSPAAIRNENDCTLSPENRNKAVPDNNGVKIQKETSTFSNNSLLDAELSLKLFKRRSPRKHKNQEKEEKKNVCKKHKHTTWIKDVGMSHNCGIEVILAAAYSSRCQKEDPAMHSSSVFSPPGTPRLIIDLSDDGQNRGEKSNSRHQPLQSHRKTDQTLLIKGGEQVSEGKHDPGNCFSYLDGQTSSANRKCRTIGDGECQYVTSVPLTNLQALFSMEKSPSSLQMTSKVVSGSNDESPAGLPGKKLLPRPIKSEEGRKTVDDASCALTSFCEALKASGGKKSKTKLASKKLRQSQGQKTGSYSRAKREQRRQKQDSSSVCLASDGQAQAAGSSESRSSPTAESQDRQRELEKAVAVLEGCLAAEDARRTWVEFDTGFSSSKQHSHVSPVKHLPLKKRHSFDFQPLNETLAERRSFRAGLGMESNLKPNSSSSEREIKTHNENNMSLNVSKPEAKRKSLSLGKEKRTVWQTSAGTSDKGKWSDAPQAHSTPKLQTYSLHMHQGAHQVDHVDSLPCVSETSILSEVGKNILFILSSGLVYARISFLQI